MNEELITQLIVLKDLLVQAVPKDERALAMLFLIMIPFSLFTFAAYPAATLAVREALREQTNLSDEQVKDQAQNYAIQYAFFWCVYPAIFIAFLVRKIKRRRKK